jgi:integrase
LIAYLEHLQATNSPYTVAARLQQLGTALKFMGPTSNDKSILLASYRLRSEARSVRNKRDRVQPAHVVASLGYDLVEKAESQQYLTPLMRAKMFRDGLILLFLSHRGIRRKNLTSLEIGKSLVLRGEEIWFVFEKHDMKSRRIHEQIVPEEIQPHILRYIKEFRPKLLACAKNRVPPANAFWVSAQGTQMTSSAIYYQVASRTKEAFGQPMAPHFFRDAIATTGAIEQPEFSDDPMAILGHSSPRITEKHYNQSNGVRVRGNYAEAISQLRRSAENGKGSEDDS